MRLKKPSIQKLRKQYENNNDIETTRIVIKTTTAKDQHSVSMVTSSMAFGAKSHPLGDTTSLAEA